MVALKRIEGYTDRTVLVRRVDGTVWNCPVYRDTELYVTPDGLLYERGFFEHYFLNDMTSRREWMAFLSPFRGLDGRDTLGLLPGHRVDTKAPYLCWRCHTDRVQCFVSGSYETSIRCPDCGTEMVVHDG